MPVPNTNGQLRTDINSMDIGDYISCRYTAGSGVAGVFSDLGADAATVASVGEIPVEGAPTPHQFFYLLKVRKGLLLADRIVQHSISWDALHAAKMIQGIAVFKNNICSGLLPSNVTANSVYSADYGYHVIDGNGAATIWQSNNVSNSPKCVTIDMNTEQNIGEVSFYPFDISGNTFSVKDYNIYVSNDNSAWEKVASGTAPNTFSWTIVKINTDKTYRYLQFEITSAYFSGTTYAGLSELKIYEKQKNQTLVRSLTGGVAFLGTDGLPKLTDQGLGAWPPVNEWDKYIVKSNLDEKIIAGDDAVWHINNGLKGTLCQDTPINGFSYSLEGVGGPWTTTSSTAKIMRGGNNIDTKKTGWCLSDNTQYCGFRPAFEFLEPNSKASNLYY